MKNIKLYINRFFLVPVFLLSVSCSGDFLNRNNPNTLEENTFFITERDADQALAAVYGRLQLSTFSGGIPLLESLGDYTLGPPSNSGFYQFFQGIETPGDGGAADARWGDCYAGIYRANYFLENIGSVEGLGESTRLRMSAEARFLRAFYYYNLVYFFGDVPLVLNVLTIDESTAAVRDPKPEVVKAILDDLDFAIENLPVAPAQQGRAVKASASGLKTRVHLYEKDYPATVTEAQKIMDGTYGSFELYPDFVNLFREAGEDNKETLFAIQYSSIELIGEGASWSSSYNSNQVTAGVLPNLVDSYEWTNGMTIEDSTSNPLYVPTSRYDPDYYKNRDPRLKATVHTPGDLWREGKAWPEYRTGKPGKVAGDYPWGQTTVYAFKKYITPELESPRIDGKATPEGTDFIVLRYADILLMYAEAKIESGDIDQSVLDAINQVRARAYGTTVDDTGNYPAITTMDQEELGTVLRRERKVEFAFEGLRWLDLVRWGMLEESRKASNRSWQANIWPVPASEITNAPGLTQNEPWK